MKDVREKVVVATIKDWNVRAFERAFGSAPQFQLISNPDLLTPGNLASINPSRIFFMHWSTLVPESIWSRFLCVNFHPSDLPFGRGGSPYQNLIIRGHGSTMMTAHRMTGGIDAGPVYLKRFLSLEGRMQAIFERAAELMCAMITEILEKNPAPVEQAGEAVVFKRRRPEQSELPSEPDATLLFNHIRMLDAETYPRAYVDAPFGRFELSEAAIDGGVLSARAHKVTSGAVASDGGYFRHGAWNGEIIRVGDDHRLIIAMNAVS